MSSPMYYQDSTSPPRSQPSSNLPPYDAQRHDRKSTLEASLLRKDRDDRASARRAKLTVFREASGSSSMQRERLPISSRTLIPPEILSEIFAYLHSQYGFISLLVNRRDFPWNVAGACSQWRRVVWRMQDMLDTVMIGSPHFVPAQVQAVRHTLSHILSVSSTLLGIVVYPPFLDVPVTYSHQIRELRLRSIEPEMLASLFLMPPDSFSHLEELDVEVDEDTCIVFPKRSLQVMPVLQALYINSKQEYLLRPVLSLPWTQLTELEVSDAMSPDNILCILRHLQHLVRTTFTIGEEEDIGTRLPINLPHLKFLSLCHESSFDVALFLGPLTLPSLEELEMIDDDWGNDFAPSTWSHQPFTSLISRSHCVITYFVLLPRQFKALGLLEDSIEPLLRALPAVETLELPPLVPSSTFMTIQQNGLLQQLTNVVWMLDAAGVGEYIDWLLSFKAGRDHTLEVAHASCHVGRRFVTAEKRFNARKAEIARAGIDAGLSRAGQDRHRFCNCEDPDTDGSEEDDNPNVYCSWFKYELPLL